MSAATDRRARKRTRREQGKRWQPLQLCPPLTRDKRKLYKQHGLEVPVATYRNDLYSVFVRDIGKGALHISFHSHDRSPVHDWRHMQAIKNEVAGPERIAVEVFPAESKLVDTSNEYHLFVLPPGVDMGFGFADEEGLVMSPEEMEESLGGPTLARQRPWQPGLPTGLGIGT